MHSESRLIFENYIKSIQQEALATGSMTVEELRAHLDTITNPTPVTVISESPPSMNKKGNPYYDGLIKRSTMNGMIGRGEGGYGRSVQNRELQAHEGDPNYMPTFKAEQLWGGYGKMIGPTMATNTRSGDISLVIANPRSGKGEYFFNGTPIDKSAVEPWLRISAPPQKQIDVGISPEATVNFRTIKLTNIKKITINNTEINIV